MNNTNFMVGDDKNYCSNQLSMTVPSGRELGFLVFKRMLLIEIIDIEEETSYL
jgi:hypothetical protein